MEDKHQRQAVIYIFVSPYSNNYIELLNTQEQEVIKYACNKNIEIIKIFRENEYDMRTNKLTEFFKMLYYIAKNKTKNLLVGEAIVLQTYNIFWPQLNYEAMGLKVHYVKDNYILSKYSSLQQKLIHNMEQRIINLIQYEVKMNKV